MATINLRVVLEHDYLAWLDRNRCHTPVHIREDGISIDRMAHHFDVDGLTKNLPPCAEVDFDEATSLRDAVVSIVHKVSSALPPAGITFNDIFGTIFFGLLSIISISALISVILEPHFIESIQDASNLPRYIGLGFTFLFFPAVTLLYWLLKLIGGPLRGYEFYYPALSVREHTFISKKSLLEYGFQSGDLIIVGQEKEVPGAIGFWANVGRDREFWSDNFYGFMYRVISERKQPRPPCVGAVVCYTEEDWAIAWYIRQNFASLHVMSGLLLTLYVFEDRPFENGVYGQQARNFWRDRLRSSWFAAWSTLGLTCTKPYPNQSVYHFCDKIRVEPDQLPCVVVFKDWKKVMTERQVIPINGDMTSFFRNFCSDIRRSLYVGADENELISTLDSTTFWSAFSERWRARIATNSHQRAQPQKAYEENDMHSVFLCHSSADKPFVEKLARDLRSLGLSIWLDKWEIMVGDSIVQKLEAGIEHNDYLAIVLSPEAISSYWVRKELNAGFMKEMEKKRVVILPILYRACDIPLLIKDKLYADFTVSYETGMEVLLKRFGLITER